MKKIKYENKNIIGQKEPKNIKKNFLPSKITTNINPYLLKKEHKILSSKLNFQEQNYSSIQNNNNNNENNEKETRESIDLMSNDLNYKSNESNSTVSGSLINQAIIDIINYNAPEPINKKDIANIPDFISSVCKISLYTNEKGVKPYLIYKLYYGEHYLEIDYSKLIKYHNALSLTVQDNIITKNLRKFFDYLKDV